MTTTERDTRNYTPLFKMAIEEAAIRSAISQTELVTFMQKGRGPAGSVDTTFTNFYSDFAQLIFLTAPLKKMRGGTSGPSNKMQIITAAEAWITPTEIGSNIIFTDRIYSGLKICRDYLIVLHDTGVISGD